MTPVILRLTPMTMRRRPSSLTLTPWPVVPTPADATSVRRKGPRHPKCRKLARLPDPAAQLAALLAARVSVAELGAMDGLTSAWRARAGHGLDASSNCAICGHVDQSPMVQTAPGPASSLDSGPGSASYSTHYEFLKVVDPGAVTAPKSESKMPDLYWHPLAAPHYARFYDGIGADPAA